jgi:hypothetical protein
MEDEGEEYELEGKFKYIFLLGILIRLCGRSGIST